MDLRAQTDAFAIRASKVSADAATRDRMAMEERLRRELLDNRLAFRSVKVKPHGYEAQAYVNVCKVLMERGRVEEAVEVLSKVIAATPHLGEARLLLGRCIAQLNSEAQQKRQEVRRSAAFDKFRPDGGAHRDVTGAVIDPYEKDFWNVVPEVPKGRPQLQVSLEDTRKGREDRAQQIDRLNNTVVRNQTELTKDASAIKETVRATELQMRAQIFDANQRGAKDVSAFKRQADRELLKELGDRQATSLVASNVPTAARESHMKALIEDLNLERQKIYKGKFQDVRDKAYQMEQDRQEQAGRGRDQTAAVLSSLYTQCVEDLHDESRRVALWEKHLGMLPGESQRDSGYAQQDLHSAAREHVNALSRWASSSRVADERRFRAEAFNAAAQAQAERDIRRRGASIKAWGCVI